MLRSNTASCIKHLILLSALMWPLSATAQTLPCSEDAADPGGPEIIAQLGRLLMSLDAEPARYTLSEYFRGAEQYERYLCKSRNVQPTLMDGVLSVSPLKVGVSFIQVVATALGGAETSQRLDVEVVPDNIYSDTHRHVPFFPAADNPLGQGFVRIRNTSGFRPEAEVRIDAFDDTGNAVGGFDLTIRYNNAIHFNSNDLEFGNPDKGIAVGLGSGQGDWRLKVSFPDYAEIQVLTYMRTPDGFLAEMNATVPMTEATLTDQELRTPIFNPAANTNQVSLLRLVNVGDTDARVTVIGVDDKGVRDLPPPLGKVSVTVPAGQSRTLSAQDIETGADLSGDLTGGIGDGVGKWSLVITAAGGRLIVMNLMQAASGHLTNLSAEPLGPAG